MSRKIDHEKLNGARRFQSQGASWTDAAELTEKEKNALFIGRERDQVAAKRREEAHKKSLVENLQPRDQQQLKRQLSSIREIYNSLSDADKVTRGKWMLNKIRSLEGQLVDDACKPKRPRKRKKKHFKK